jgi:hypothetical protein
MEEGRWEMEAKERMLGFIEALPNVIASINLNQDIQVSIRP